MPDEKTIRVWKYSSFGEFEDQPALENAAHSLDQVSATLPQGVYTSFRTYDHFQGLHLGDHFRRLVDGAASLGIPIRLIPAEIRPQLHTILTGLKGSEYRFRLSVDLEKQPGDLYVLAEPLTTPTQENYRFGVKTLVRPFQRQNPETKYTRFILDSSSYRKLISKDINEVLLFDLENNILEGLSSNFYGAIKGVLYTADTGILPGITRSIVMEEARKQGVKVAFDPIGLDTIQTLDEAFLTSASRAVLPVARVENQNIGAGQAGEITRLLGDLYNNRIQSELEEI